MDGFFVAVGPRARFVTNSSAANTNWNASNEYWTRLRNFMGVKWQLHYLEDATFSFYEDVDEVVHHDVVLVNDDDGNQFTFTNVIATVVLD